MLVRRHHRTRADRFADGLIHRRAGFGNKVLLFFFNITERIVPWYRWPRFTLVPILYLVLRRRTLAQVNLVEVPQPTNTDIGHRVAARRTLAPEERPMHREDDGFGNDAEHPGAGTSGSAIGRNMPIVPNEAREALEYPDPQYVAQRLMARRPGPHTPHPSGFIPCGMQLNILAAAWVQTMVTDLIDHEYDTTASVTLDKGYDAECPLETVKVHPTHNAAEAAGGTTYLNPRTAWWDASFVYGQNAASVSKARTGEGGKLHVADDALPVGPDGQPILGDRTAPFAGVLLLQDLFAREHNAIATAIAAAEPSLDDEALFRKARLVLAAVVAKIHTLDWTPELVKTPTLRSGMHVNWNGLMGMGPKLFGLVGMKKARNHGIPYSLTEEFASVYRMDSMLPDDVHVEEGPPVPLSELVGPNATKYVQEKGMKGLWQAMLRYPCGALKLFNYPEALRAVVPLTSKPDGTVVGMPPIDQAAVDIYRDRERGLPRYNEFRQWLNMRPYQTWKELTGGDKEAMAALEEVYGVDIDLCDLMVGNLAEKKIPGFAISETAFMVFLLMASRRLEADRFFTEHFNRDVYTDIGFEWVSSVWNLRDVLKRHYPALEQELPPGESAFTPYASTPVSS